MKSTYNFSPFYTNNNDKSFKIIALSIHNIFQLADDIFVVTKEKELKKAKLLAKNRIKLTFYINIKFNGSYIRLVNDN